MRPLTAGAEQHPLVESEKEMRAVSGKVSGTGREDFIEDDGHPIKLDGTPDSPLDEIIDTPGLDFAKKWRDGMCAIAAKGTNFHEEHRGTLKEVETRLFEQLHKLEAPALQLLEPSTRRTQQDHPAAAAQPPQPPHIAHGHHREEGEREEDETTVHPQPQHQGKEMEAVAVVAVPEEPCVSRSPSQPHHTDTAAATFEQDSTTEPDDVPEDPFPQRPHASPARTAMALQPSAPLAPEQPSGDVDDVIDVVDEDEDQHGDAAPPPAPTPTPPAHTPSLPSPLPFVKDTRGTRIPAHNVPYQPGASSTVAYPGLWEVRSAHQDLVMRSWAALTDLKEGAERVGKGIANAIAGLFGQ
ncbi:unnamed protein product [Vitrella brassicaformis CCMP3155]|uniref:Uncharacterized protein n=1 Tax=Vitrella brassicaformis (strain CCMP3155) TaxID=1169540 RepID=A0A0G4GXN4_VITBC|nr:unnamed protein product [Vitrella brassicaformis CCMP3155]|eukprot:CEM35612.1 unnamed protein product [Vitrella brassicaformis CCMP3155]